jgi:stress-induced morphogen
MFLKFVRKDQTNNIHGYILGYILREFDSPHSFTSNRTIERFSLCRGSAENQLTRQFQLSRQFQRTTQLQQATRQFQQTKQFQVVRILQQTRLQYYLQLLQTMERTALAGMRRCLRSGRGLRCTTQSPNGPKCVAMSICPSKNIANSTAGISNSANRPPPSATRNKAMSSLLRSRLSDTQSLRRGYSSESPAAQDTLGEGVEGKMEGEKVREVLVAPDHMDAAEKEVFELLNEGLEPKALVVRDVSGGCGTMYFIEVKSERFRGLGMLKQQRLVNGILGERVKSWHGVQMKTGVP